MSLVGSPSASPVKKIRRVQLIPPPSKTSNSHQLFHVTPQKRNDLRSYNYNVNENGQIINFNDVDLMRANKSTKILSFDEITGFKNNRELQYFLPYSSYNMNLMEKYGDASFYYYYRPKNVIVYSLPYLKDRLVVSKNDDFDDNLLRTRISDNESSDSDFFGQIRDSCASNSLKIDGIYSPSHKGMHEEVILFYPKRLIEEGRMEILSTFMF